MNVIELLKKTRIALTPRSSLLKSVLSNGAIVYGKNRAGYGGRGIYIWGDSLEPELAHLHNFLDTNDVVLDIGANTGVYTVKAAKHVGAQGLVIAVEPNIEILDVLSLSVKANGFGNVRLRNLCIGRQTQARTLWMNRGGPNSFSIAMRDDDSTSLSVLAVTLDDLCRWEAISRLDYLKIDVEGAEEEVFSGGKETIKRFRPMIQVETNKKIFPLELPEYSSFQTKRSPNKIIIPNESDKIEVAFRLGWQRMPS
jgi:FkbM family methyltransferase